VNNTVIENTALEKGGGICFHTNAVLSNSILWENKAPSGSEIELFNYLYPFMLATEYCDVMGGKSSVHVEEGSILQWGPGMLDSDPLFIDPAGGDYHITFNSPCRGSGSNQVQELPDTDFEGDPRIAYGTVDIGADEFYTHLYVTGEKTPGGSIEGKLVGLPGTSPVGLFVGSGIADPPIQSAWGLFYLQAPWWLVPLIPIPSEGILVLPATIPLSPAAPYDLPMQGLIGLSPESLTNLEVLEVR
jgi:predicted outer membrane repeat protein